MKSTYCKFCGKPLQSSENDSCAECVSFCMKECELVKSGEARSWHRGACITCGHNPYKRCYTFRDGEWIREPRYEVAEDLQGCEFGMERKYTVEQWRRQALEWCFMDDDDWEAAHIMRIPNNELIDYIGEYWTIRLERVRDDVPISSDDIDAYSDETPQEFYEKWFDPQPEDGLPHI